MFSIKHLIAEEVHDFVSDYAGYSDEYEPTNTGIADKYYAKNIGVMTKEPEVKIDAELIGYVVKQLKYSKESIPVYKNPKSLNGFSPDTRAVLLSDGNLYVAKTYAAMHENILKLLAEKNIIPESSIYGYGENYPRYFIAVDRISNTNSFGQSNAYEDFPNYYMKIFETAEAKQPFGFKNY